MKAVWLAGAQRLGSRAGESRRSVEAVLIGVSGRGKEEGWELGTLAALVSDAACGEEDRAGPWHCKDLLL